MIIKPQRFLCDSLLYSAEREPDKIALVIEGESYTYSQLAEESSRMASGLLARGLHRGDRVAIYMDNTCRVLSVFMLYPLLAACF